MYFHCQKQSQMIFFVFFFQISKIAFPGIMIPFGHSQQLFQSAILGHQSWFLAYLMKIDIRLQQGCLPCSPVFRPDFFFEYAFHRVLFWLIFICAYLRFYSNMPFVPHDSPENYTCCMCHQSCRPRDGVKRAVTGDMDVMSRENLM